MKVGQIGVSVCDRERKERTDLSTFHHILLKATSTSKLILCNFKARLAADGKCFQLNRQKDETMMRSPKCSFVVNEIKSVDARRISCMLAVVSLISFLLWVS